MNPDNDDKAVSAGKLPERSILQRIAGGEENGFRECVEKYGDMIWRLAKRRAGSEAGAEALTLEIFRELWKCAADFDPETGAEEAFIRRIVYRGLMKTRESP